MTESSASIEPGTVLAGKYRIDKRIGRGGMGAVYLAHNEDIGRRVAIKVLHEKYSENKELLARFRQEARAAAAIEHPGIVDILDIGHADDGSAFMVMEYLDGESLRATMQRQQRMPVLELVRIATELLEALGAAHDAGIIHRDLKPDNVFLTSKPRRAVKLLDFGISKLHGKDAVDITQTGEIIGTPLYMPPEQARGAKDVTESADLYSVGAVLYHALTGRPPFTGDSYAEVLAKVLTEPPAPIESVRKDVPLELCSLVTTLLAKKPEVRPQSVRDVIDWLARAVKSDAAPPADADAIAGAETVPSGTHELAGAETAPSGTHAVAADETIDSGAANTVAAVATASATPEPPLAGLATTHATASGQVQESATGTPPASRGPMWLAIAALGLAAIGGTVYVATRTPEAVAPIDAATPADAATADSHADLAVELDAAATAPDAGPAMDAAPTPRDKTGPRKPPRRPDAGAAATKSDAGAGTSIPGKLPHDKFKPKK